jgi:two-component system NtrC family response regulator
MGKVLIIDDDRDYADMIACQVRILDHDVKVCLTLGDGLAQLPAFEPEVVFLDVRLPDGNGLDAAREIKAAPGSPEVVIITGSGDEEGAELAVRAGAWDYWQKGRAAKGIVLTLRRAMDYRRERLARRRGQALDLDGLVGGSHAMAACFDFIAEAAASDAPVLLHGETGTGKEVVARAIHRNSARAKKSFVVVDCASLTETLVESSLFGHDKGAYTGASSERSGLVRQAHEGTLFLDEIGELPLAIQKSFLRVLQEKRFRPLGCDRELSSDFRMLAATNRDLASMVSGGTFREDLYFRLRSLELTLPPLREREHDVLKIAKHLVVRICERLGITAKCMSPTFEESLLQYSWPGNVRELTGALECALACAGDAPALDPVHLPLQVRIKLARDSVRPDLNLQRPQAPYASYPTLSAVRDTAVTAYLTKLLKDTNGDMDAACELADLSRSRLYELLKVHGIGRAVANEH